jgi:hypothetical protein
MVIYCNTMSVHYRFYISVVFWCTVNMIKFEVTQLVFYYNCEGDEPAETSADVLWLL